MGETLFILTEKQMLAGANIPATLFRTWRDEHLTRGVDYDAVNKRMLYTEATLATLKKAALPSLSPACDSETTSDKKTRDGGKAVCDGLPEDVVPMVVYRADYLNRRLISACAEEDLADFQKNGAPPDALAWVPVRDARYFHPAQWVPVRCRAGNWELACDSPGRPGVDLRVMMGLSVDGR